MLRRPGTLALSLALALAAAGDAGAPFAQDAEPAFPPPLNDPFVLPEGDLAELFERLAAARPEHPAPPRLWPVWSDRSASGWGGERAWREWVELVRAEARHAASVSARASSAVDPEQALRRARLALLAVDQGRSSDAWRHVLAMGEHPLALTILPALLPGLPLERLGSAEPLPAGTLLRPMLPPPRLDVRGDVDPLGPLIGRVMEERELRVADSLLSLSVIVESDGVQIDVKSRAGPTVDVRILPPVPPGVRVGLLYADWTKVGTELAEVPLSITGDGERHTIWARFRPGRVRWPSPPEPGAIESGADRERAADIEVVVPRERLDDPVARRFTEALAQLFGESARLRAVNDHGGAGPFEPIAIHLGDADGGDERLVGLVSMVEAQALAGAALR